MSQSRLKVYVADIIIMITHTKRAESERVLCVDASSATCE